MNVIRPTAMRAAHVLAVIICVLVVAPTSLGAVINYEYNSKGQLWKIHYDDGTEVVYGYDENGNRTSVTSAGGPDVKAPTIPTALSATAVSSTRIDVSWGASTDGGSSGLAGYKLERCQDAACSTPLVLLLAASPFQDTSLAPSTTYWYRLRAYDNATPPNHSLYTATVSATTPLDTTPPVMPGSGLNAVVASSTQINLTWTAASDSGGSGLAGYKIERCQGSATCTNFSQIQQQAGLTFHHGSLAANTIYRYRVRAYDNAGNNSTTYSNIVTATTSADTTAPSQPTNLVATAASGTQINLTWTGSTDSGGSNLSGYKIERCQGAGCSNFAQIGTSATAGYSDSGLTASTSYSYRVRAYDGAGNNSTNYSNTASATTPADITAPTTPSSLAASATSSTQINLTWTGSTDSGGSGLAGYKIERCQNAGCSNFAQIGTSTSASYSDSGRASTTTYVYRVRAYDNAGNNSTSYSNSASATTLADTSAPTVPGSPTVSNATALQLTVSWAVSTDSGGSGLAGYKVERCAGAGCSSFAQIVTTTSTSYTDPGLPPNATYRYQVRAYDNASPANHSAYSAAVQGATLPDTTAPTAPTGLAGSASGSQISLNWTGSTDSGGSGLTGYRIERCSGTCASFSQVGTSASTTFTDSGLADVTTYTYRVFAYDGASNISTASNTVSITTPDNTRPNPPTGYSFSSVTSTSATVTWSGATDNALVTGYQYRVIPGDGWHDVGSVTSAALVNLTCYTSYTVEVQARDAVGFGASSSGSFQTLDGCAPGAPGAPSFSNISYTSATATWTPASDNVGVTGYQYSVSGGASWVDIGSSPATISNLTAMTQYTVVLRARDAAGNWGPASGAGSFQTLAPTITLPQSSQLSSNFTSAGTALFYLEATGNLWHNASGGGGSYFGTWLSPQVSMSLFEVYATPSGSNCNGTFYQWLNLGADRSWSVTNTAHSGTQTCTVTLQIRKVGTTTVLGTGSVTANATGV